MFLWSLGWKICKPFKTFVFSRSFPEFVDEVCNLFKKKFIVCQPVPNACSFFSCLGDSTRDLRRERETLSKLMQKRFSEDERKRLFQKWGIALNSKRRRLQLVSQLWSDPKNMNHVTESAAIVAKLVKFAEQGQALKGNFGLSFITPPQKSRSFSWINNRTTLMWPELHIK